MAFNIHNQNARNNGRPLFERRRPNDWSEVIGQDKILAKLERLSAEGLSGRAYWINGFSGGGKTTIARLIAKAIVGDKQGAYLGIEEIDAKEVTYEKIKTWRDELSRGSLFGDGRVYIINEAHGLRQDIVLKLLCLLEPIPSDCAFIFTTTTDGQTDFLDGQLDAHPFLSRCVNLPLEKMGVADKMAARALEIAIEEGLDGRPLVQYKKLVQNCRMNFRAVLQAIDAGEMLT